MPGFNGQGPENKGPGTGWGRGPCTNERTSADANVNQTEETFPRFGAGRRGGGAGLGGRRSAGTGRGMGRRRGRMGRR